MLRKIAIGAVALAALGGGVLWALGTGLLVRPWDAGRIRGPEVPHPVVQSREAAVRRAAESLGVEEPDEILFGDLHVHTTFSGDAFQLSLPMAGGEGAHPVADACDFARYCSALDFWSINDHAITSTPERWAETVDAIRRCNAVASDPKHPDTVAFLGWEWTQIGSTPTNHYGHKNVVLRDLEDGRIPTRPIAAGPPAGTRAVTDFAPGPLTLGLMAAASAGSGGIQAARYLHDMSTVPTCPEGVAERALPTDCRELAATPERLFAKLDDWGFPALVIPHGTTWGMYTPPGSAWDKQLTPSQHHPARQRLIEVFSGHGNSEEYRPWRQVEILPDGTRRCPEPTPDFLPSCWRAGEIIEERCRAAGRGEQECARRAARTRQLFVDADRNGGAWVVPGTKPEDWQDAGLCRDCFQPAFGYRPRSSVQYILALARPGQAPADFQLGFIASSDNHSARPGTGYKEIARREFTEARFGEFPGTPLGIGTRSEPSDEPRAFDPNTRLPPFAFWETERAASFFLNGGLAAVHAHGRDRQAIWEALERRETYGTSGPRILLWFDLVAGAAKVPSPMGSRVKASGSPTFEVRAVGPFEQKPGCPPEATGALSPERLARLCRNECYNPSDRRRPITRIEVVRIRRQLSPDEDVGPLIEDPWRTFACPPDPSGCRVRFSDEDFLSGGRDTAYYVRAIEAPSLAVDADPLHCKRDASGRCVEMDPCFERPDDDDCLAPTEERAWSSPIYLDQPRS